MSAVPWDVESLWFPSFTPCSTLPRLPSPQPPTVSVGPRLEHSNPPSCLAKQRPSVFSFYPSVLQNIIESLLLFLLLLLLLFCLKHKDILSPTCLKAEENSMRFHLPPAVLLGLGLSILLRAAGLKMGLAGRPLSWPNWHLLANIGLGGEAAPGLWARKEPSHFSFSLENTPP